MTLASLRNMTDEEFLLYHSNERYRSPVIGELCGRLEALLEGEPLDISRHVQCPVCRAELDASYDAENDVLNIRTTN